MLTIPKYSKALTIVSRRPQYRTKSLPDNSRIFEIRDEYSRNRKLVTISEVRDAIDTSRGLSCLNKSDYFYSLGIDYEKVKTYYEIVSELEALYESPRTIGGIIHMISSSFSARIDNMWFR